MAIEVRFDTAARGGLRVVSAIPALRPCKLEGRNGIGKSVLVRLLVLASGVQPYPGDPGAWRSLRELVGPSVMTVNGLSGDFASAKLRFSPELWPQVPPAEIGDWLGEAEFDGEAGSISRLFETLSVVHLAGTEKLLDTLQHRYPRMAVALSAVEKRLNDLENQRAALGELGEQLEHVSPRQAACERETAAREGSRQGEIGAQIKAKAPVERDLSTAVALTALLDSGDADAHHAELERLRSRLDDARKTQPAAEARYDAAVEALDAGSDAQRQAARLERRLRTQSKRYDQLLSRQTELAPRLEQVGVPADAQKLDAEQQQALRRMHDHAVERQRQERDRLARRRRGQDENEVLDELRVVLAGASNRGLGGMVLAHLNGSDLTADELAFALGQVADVDLDGWSTDEAQPLVDANAAVSAWAELMEVFEEKTSVGASISETRSELARVAPQVEEQDELDRAAEDAREQLREVDEEIRAIQIEIGARQGNLGGADVEEARAKVLEILTRHQVDPVRLSSKLSECQLGLQALREEEESLTRVLQDLADKAAQRRVQRANIRQRARTDPELVWLTELAVSRAAGPSMSEDWDDETWQSLSDHVAAVRLALRELSGDVSALRTVAESRTPAGRYGQTISAVIEQDAVRYLSAAPIARALFDGGHIKRVSLEDQSITWETPGGDRRTRPLSVFSSGEQALGFIRAQLEEIAATPARNRLIFLDEFGAFISADRRRPLAELLTSDDLAGLANQVVVILPLQADYTAELEQTTGNLRDVYERRAAEIAEHGYFTEEFEG